MTNSENILRYASFLSLFIGALLVIAMPFFTTNLANAVFDSDGRASVTVPDPIQGGIIQGIAVGADGDVYVAYGQAYNLESKIYHFSNTQTLLSTKTVTYCGPLEPLQDHLFVSSMTVDEAGALYVSITAAFSESVGSTASSCVQKYSANGDLVPGFATDIDGSRSIVSGLFSNHAGKIYANVYNQNVSSSILQIIDQNGQPLGDVDSLNTEGETLSIHGGVKATYNGDLYIANRFVTGEIYVFSAEGNYLRTMTIGASVEHMTIDTYGRIFTIMGNSNYGSAYYNGSLQTVTGISPVGVSLYAFASTVDARYWAGYDASTSHTVYVARPAEAPRFAPVVEISNITDANAQLSITADAQELPLMGATVGYEVTNSVTGAVSSGTLDYAGESIVIPLGPLDPGTEYTYSAQIGNAAGSQGDSGTFMTLGAAPQPTVLAAVPSIESGKKVLLVSGSRLGDYSGALGQSLVTLNGNALPFCSDGVGATAAEIVAMYGVSPSLVSDTPACYWLIKDGSIAYTLASAVVWLRDDFDMLAQGTVSVNGSSAYTFNENTGGETPIEPTAHVTGDKPLDQHPTVPTLPTFSGVAEPGATVTVTAYLDPISCTTIADVNGNWSCTLPSELPAGEHTVYVRVVNPDSSVEELGPYAITVAGGTITNTTPTAPNTGFFKTLQVFKEQKITSKNNAIMASVGVGAIVVLIGFAILYAVSVRKKRYSLQD